ncbi:hypothetical protein GW17_00052320 [Ensete ventricosum]|nr:hypothetical protein GW17_00052320 [Ensete ventricosum]
MRKTIMTDGGEETAVGGRGEDYDGRWEEALGASVFGSATVAGTDDNSREEVTTAAATEEAMCGRATEGMTVATREENVEEVEEEDDDSVNEISDGVEEEEAAAASKVATTAATACMGRRGRWDGKQRSSGEAGMAGKRWRQLGRALATWLGSDTSDKVAGSW